jgi:RNA polymerase sigma-70 factor (ECF subfamily)
MMTFQDPPIGTPGSRGAPRIDGPGAAAADAARRRPPARAPVTGTGGPTTPGSVSDLLELHGAEIHRHLRRLTLTAEDAADLHQETFLRAHRAWDRLPPEANHRAWLHRIAANVATDAYRRRAVRAVEAAAPDAAAEHAAGASDDPAARAEAAELRATVRSALAALPARERAAVVARVLEGAAYAEVAEILDCTDENARQIVSRGLRRLRATLVPHLETHR